MLKGDENLTVSTYICNYINKSIHYRDEKILNMYARDYFCKDRIQTMKCKCNTLC